MGVSGGPDSMALLDMLRKKDKENLVVVHVNYQMRESAHRDQELVENYCHQHHIPVISYQVYDLTRGNFQHNARHFRLRCFKEVYEGYQATTLYLGHHLDDQLETILFELLTHREPEHLGIQPLSKLMGMLVKRPFLNHTKKELVQYCHRHNIRYGIDESNHEPKYTRNAIRIALKSMSSRDKQALLDYQKVYSKRRQLLKKESLRFLGRDKTSFKVDAYLELDKHIRLYVLREYLKQNGLKTTKMSRKHVNELDRLISLKQNLQSPLSNHKSLLIDYGKVKLMETLADDYEFVIHKIERVDTPYFKLNQHAGMGLTVSESDFPLKIRNARKDDTILMKYGTKKLNRFFIDRKISHRDRRTWPVIENKAGEVIFVAELGCDVNHHQLPYNLKLKRKNYGY